jgi:hypothetical protein
MYAMPSLNSMTLHIHVCYALPNYYSAYAKQGRECVPHLRSRTAYAKQERECVPRLRSRRGLLARTTGEDYWRGLLARTTMTLHVEYVLMSVGALKMPPL